MKTHSSGMLAIAFLRLSVWQQVNASDGRGGKAMQAPDFQVMSAAAVSASAIGAASQGIRAAHHFSNAHDRCQAGNTKEAAKDCGKGCLYLASGSAVMCSGINLANSLGGAKKRD